MKIRENSEKNQGTPSLRPFLRFGVFGAVELLKGGLGNLKVKNIFTNFSHYVQTKFKSVMNEPSNRAKVAT